jgi:hypothetical protein
VGYDVGLDELEGLADGVAVCDRLLDHGQVLVL